MWSKKGEGLGKGVWGHGTRKLSLPEVEWLPPDHINFPFSQDIQPFLLQRLPYHSSLRWRNAHWVVLSDRARGHIGVSIFLEPAVSVLLSPRGHHAREQVIAWEEKAKIQDSSAGPWRSRPWIARILWMAQTGLVLAILLLQLPHHVQLVVLHSLRLVLASPLVLGMNDM